MRRALLVLPLLLAAPLYPADAGDGRPDTMEKTIDAWMNPDTSKTFDLETIADHVDVSLDSGADADHVREALVEIHILQAVADDDPENPAYLAIESLKRVRHASDER